MEEKEATNVDSTQNKSGKYKWSGRGRNKNGKIQKGKWTNKKKTKFYGDTREMYGHVFQVRLEQSNNSQFQDTLEQLKIYASKHYKKEIKLLRKLFNDLELPSMPKPIPPKIEEPKVKTEEGKETTIDIKKYQEALYNEEIKLWMKKKENLDTTLTSLYNITWGH